MNTFFTSRAWRFGAAAAFLGILILAGCRPKNPPKPDWGAELPPGQLALRKISPAEYPDFSPAFANLQGLAQAIDNSEAYLLHASSRQYFPYLDITHDRALATMRLLRQVVATVRTPAQLNAEICDKFEVYKSIGAPNPEGPGYTDRVLFTGYFTPIYDASLLRGGPYQWPIYKRPADLATNSATGDTLGRKTPDGQVVPYYTRAQIDQGALAGKGLELAWLKNRFEAYVVTIQGSARLRLPDGRVLKIGYAGNNGYEYTSPNQRMIADGVISRENWNLRNLKAFFDANPSAMDRYLWLNNRYVFFTEREGGPYGSLNVPVTMFRSIATDKAVYPRAMPAFLNVPVPVSVEGDTQQFQGFMMDQDTGGGIRASGRCDIYMGIGDDAERIAGHQLHDGELYYIAVKPQYVNPSAAPVAPAAPQQPAAPAQPAAQAQ